jgi:putative peptide zinc metalloprotease protein
MTAAIMSAAAGAPTIDAAPQAPSMRLMPLRDELTLHEGPRTLDGAPTWTLHDPITNRFFRIGWLEFEILSRWDLGDIEQIAADIAARTTIPVTAAQVENFARFLVAGNLIQARGPDAIERFKRQVAATRKTPAMWLLKNYLFFRIPLVRPDRFLKAALPMVDWVFTRWFLALVMAAALVGGSLVVRQWDSFTNTFMHFFTPEGAALAAIALFASKLLHEFGHAFAARRFGCRVPTMGAAFLVMWPVLYTDTSEAWKLASKRRRLAIGVAGMSAELALAAFATLAWSFLPDGPLRSAAFLQATSTWVITLTINLSPFMRFDGYYLLSDYLDIANLQDRSFALARWWLREKLFGFGDPPPEHFPARTRRILMFYAYGTWIYRFFLFLTIALLVYHLFFKLLGIFLMGVELVWFIARPIWGELAEWATRRDRVRINRNSVATLVGFIGLIALMLIPWRGSVPAPAIVRAEQQTQLFVPKAAMLSGLLAQPGQQVTAGDVLFRFTSPDLEHSLEQAQRKAQVLRWQVQFQGMNRDLLERNQVSWRELEAAQAESAGFKEELDRLVVSAPISGRVVELADPLLPGEWLKENTPLAMLIDPASGIVEAYVGEEDLSRIAVGGAGVFHPDDLDLASIPVTIISIDDGSSRTLAEHSLASINGGDIPVRQGTGGDHSLVPESPIYRVLLRPDGGLEAPERVQRGKVLLEGQRESIAGRTLRVALGVLVRESGF